MQLPPEVRALYFAEELKKLESGAADPEQRINGLPVKLSEWVRVRKLIDLVGDEAQVLAHINMDPALYARATQGWGGLAGVLEVGARIRFLYDRLDLSEEVARLRAGNVTKGLLEPDPGVFLGPSGEVWALGRFASGVAPPMLRAVAFERGDELWRNETKGLASGRKHKGYSIRPPRIYIARQHIVTALDLQTGKTLWEADLLQGESIATNRDGSDAIHDPGLGVVMVRLQSQQVVGIACETGAFMYKVPFGKLAGPWTPPHQTPEDAIVSEDVAGVGMAVHGGPSMSRFAVVVDARTGRPLAQACRGPMVQGAAARRGVLAHSTFMEEPRGSVVDILDAATGRPLIAPVMLNGLASNEDPLFAGPWVFFRAVHDPGFLYAIALPGHSPPQREIAMGNVEIVQLAATADSLVACISVDQTGDVGLCILDAFTLAIRGSTKNLGPRVREQQSEMLVADENLALLATQGESDDAVMLWAVDVHKGVRWSLQVQGWLGHGFAGERVVVWTKDQTLLVRAEDGASMAL